LSGRLYRLLRLARAQAEMVKALESKLAQEERSIAVISRKSAEIDTLATGAGAINPASLPAMLRSLASLDSELKQITMEADRLKRQLLEAKGREKVISTRLKLLRDSAERKMTEEQAMETTLVLMAKASGKRGVVN
jgi:chromosome segregation ATPase